MNEQDHEHPPASEAEVQMRGMMQALAEGLQEALPKNWGFFLMTFPLKDQPGSMNYVSKARREDILLLMLEFCYRTLGGPEGILTNKPPKEKPATNEDARKLATALQELVSVICLGERDVTVEDCDYAKSVLRQMTGKDWQADL